jgi:cell division protein FtsQ
VLKIRQLIKGVRLPLGGLLLALVIVFAETRYAEKTCQNIIITIAGKEEQQFITKEALLQRLTANAKEPILGTPLQTLETRSIESIVKAHNFVREGIVYKTWQGDLKIAIIPRRPIARIIYPHQQSKYIDEDGTLLVLSDQYTARVIVLETEQLGVQKHLTEHVHGTGLLALLNYIDRDPFWRAQIVYMHINERGKITMHTQISRQRIEFGLPEATEEKLAKLKLFYKQIVPYKGWNTYKRVNIEFDNQIVCE